MAIPKLLQASLNLLYEKIFRINDTAHKISLGLGLGVFCGIIPGTGPIAALFLALLLRVNRAAALLGSLLTNTWLSIITFILSVKIGSVIMGLDWQSVRGDWLLILDKFRWISFFKLSVLKIVLPVVVGYVIVAFILGIATYLIALVILIKAKYTNQPTAA